MLEKMASYIVNSKWYEDREIDIQEDSERIVVTAANLLNALIRKASSSKDMYPSSVEFQDTQHARNWIPKLLNSFLDHLVCSDVKKAALGHSIVQAVRPKTVISPLLVGLIVSLDHVFGGWLINLLSRLGFFLSYDELIRFQQSVVQCDSEGCLPPYPVCYTQFVADNVGHNVCHYLCTLDGLNTFHGMGIISVSTICLLDEAVNGKFADFPIPRLPRKKVADVVCSRGIPILHYSVRQKSDLCSISFSNWNAVKQLMCGQPASTAQDLLWHVGWFFSSQSVPRLNWSGFMHDINADKLCLPCADFRMWPILDLNTNDLTCIYSILRFIYDQSAKVGIPTPCITFDHPLWLKAVDIIQSEKLNIVCRLGPFHTNHDKLLSQHWLSYCWIWSD